MKKRALVISGGGAKGAFAGGLAHKLYEKGHRWDNYYGTSTGALLNTLIPLSDFDNLKDIYTNVNNKNIFDKPPFTQRGKLNIFRAIWRVIRGKTSIGSARNLRKLIASTYTKNKHDIILQNNKSVCACVTNYTKGEVEHIYNNEFNYETFVDFVFASASVPIAMDLVKINDYEYLDGGVMEHVPLQQAITDGVDEVDVILLKPNYDEFNMYWKSNNIIGVALHSMKLMMKEIGQGDLIISKLQNKLGKNVVINLYYIPNDLTGNSLVFDPETMKIWWDTGYRVDIPDYAEDNDVNGLKLKKYRITVMEE